MLETKGYKLDLLRYTNKKRNNYTHSTVRERGERERGGQTEPSEAEILDEGLEK